MGKGEDKYKTKARYAPQISNSGIEACSTNQIASTLRFVDAVLRLYRWMCTNQIRYVVVIGWVAKIEGRTVCQKSAVM